MSVATLANKTVAWERGVESLDSFGATVKDYTSQGTLAARVQPRRGTETVLYGKEEMRVTHRVYTPGSPDVQPTDRFKVDGLTLYVLVVRNIDLVSNHLEIDCEQRDQ